jgi:hypothetical protein
MLDHAATPRQGILTFDTYTGIDRRVQHGSDDVPSTTSPGAAALFVLFVLSPTKLHFCGARYRTARFDIFNRFGCVFDAGHCRRRSAAMISPVV